jgi:hypothetical protein
MHGILRNTKQGTHKGKFKKVELSVNIGEEDDRTERGEKRHAEDKKRKAANKKFKNDMAAGIIGERAALAALMNPANADLLRDYASRHAGFPRSLDMFVRDVAILPNVNIPRGLSVSRQLTALRNTNITYQDIVGAGIMALASLGTIEGLRRDTNFRSFREEFLSMPVSDGSDHTAESTPAESSGRGQRRRNSSDEEDNNTDATRERGNKRHRTVEKGSPK